MEHVCKNGHVISIGDAMSGRCPVCDERSKCAPAPAPAPARYTNNDTWQLINSIRVINAYPYVPAVVKMQMVMLNCQWREASNARDWDSSAAAQDALAALEAEYLPLPSLSQPIPNEESSLYAAALAAEK